MAKYEPDCVDPTVGELLVEHAGGRLAEAERRRFEAHLELCLACREQVVPMRRLLRALESRSLDGPDGVDALPRRSLFSGAPGMILLVVLVAVLLIGLTWQRAHEATVLREVRSLDERLRRLEDQSQARPLPPPADELDAAGLPR